MKITPYFSKIAAGTNYENIFGPNWETLNNFYLFYEQLNHEQERIVAGRRLEIQLQYKDIIKHRRYLDNQVLTILGIPRYYNLISNGWRVGFETGSYPMMEIIAMDKIIEDGKQFIYLPLFDNL